MLKLCAHLAPVLTVATIIALGVAGSFSTTSPVFVALYLAAIAIAVAARRAFPPGTFRGGPPPAGRSVIRRGPYRVVRHPMYSAALLLVWSAVGAHVQVWTIGLGVVVTGAAVGRVIWEERLLRATFPDYADYARSTRALIPYIV
jgi:protein-S-isoprenylcysteine O-methyltransferase Ste14